VVYGNDHDGRGVEYVIARNMKPGKTSVDKYMKLFYYAAGRLVD
jgi:hypothetical protein